MAAELILEAKNEASPAMGEVIKSLEGIAKASGITSDAGKTLQRELKNQNWADYKRQVKAAAEELNGIAQKKREAAAAAAKLAEETRQATEATKRLAEETRDAANRQQANVRAVVDVYRVLKDVVNVAKDAVVAMAEEGNPAAMSLVASIEELKKELHATAQASDGVKSAMYGAGDAIRALIPGVKSVVEFIGMGYEFSEKMYQNLIRIYTVLAGTSKQFDETLEGLKRQREADEKKIANERELLKVGKEKLTVVKSVADEEEEAIKRGTEEALKAADRIEQREEEARRKSQEAAEWQMRYLEEVENIKKRTQDAEIQRQRQMNDLQQTKTDALKQEQKILEDRQKAALGAAGQGNVEGILGSVDPRKARAQLAKQRDEQFMASGAGDNMTASELRRERASIRRNTFKQFNQGNVSQNDMIEAQSAVVEKQLQASGQAAKMGGVAVDAFKDAVSGLQQIKGEQEAQEQELEYMRKVLGGIMGRKGQRRNDQNWGR